MIAIGIIVLETYGLFETFANFKSYYEINGFWIILGGGMTPFPYKLVTIASGFFGLNVYTFIVMSIISRGVRFFIIAALLWFFGPAIKIFIEKNLGKLTILFFILFLSGFILLKYIK